MTISINTPDDFDFLQCINSHGWRQLAPFLWDAETGKLRRTHRLADGRVVELVIYDEAGTLRVGCSADTLENEIEQSVKRMLQLDISMAEFRAFCESHPKLCDVPSLKQGRMLRSPTLFEDIVKVIATTNTTWIQTKGMVERIVGNFGLPLPTDPSRRAFPTPEQIAVVSLDEFAEKAKMGYRNSSVHKLAWSIVSGELDLESWQGAPIPPADLTKKLLALPGVGPYAASCLMIYLGRYNRVNVDSWARTMVGRELGRTVTDKEVHAFFEPYGDWQALVYHFYPWKEEPPAY